MKSKRRHNSSQVQAVLLLVSACITSGCVNGVIGSTSGDQPFLQIPMYYPNRSGSCTYSALSMWQTYRFLPEKLAKFGIVSDGNALPFPIMYIESAYPVNLTRFDSHLASVSVFYGNDLKQMRDDHPDNRLIAVKDWIKVVVGDDIGPSLDTFPKIMEAINSSCNTYKEPAYVAVRGPTFLSIDATRSFDHAVLVSGVQGFGQNNGLVYINDPNGMHYVQPPYKDVPTYNRNDGMLYTDSIAESRWKSWSSNETTSRISGIDPGKSFAFIVKQLIISEISEVPNIELAD